MVMEEAVEEDIDMIDDVDMLDIQEELESEGRKVLKELRKRGVPED